MPVKNNLFLSLFFFVFIGGCSREPAVVSQHQFLYDFEVEDITYPEKLSTFTVEPMRFSVEYFENNLLQTSITEVETTALGPVYQTTSDEYLNIFDDGDEYGIKTGLDGGFSYSRELSKETFPYSLLGVTQSQKQVSDLSFYKDFTFKLQRYESPEDLNFLSKEKALIEIKALFQQITNNSVKLMEKLSYSLTVEKMLEQIETSNIKREFPRLPTREDEAYVFLLQQEIKGIPLMNNYWESRTADEEYPHLLPEVVAIYKNEGMISIEVRNIVQENQELGDVIILSPVEILKSFEQQLLIADMHIESCDLEYLIIHEKKEKKIIPVWRLLTWQTTSYKGTDQPIFEYPEYRTLIFDAETGQAIKGD